ncbi:MAG: restriction endonuclease subunit S [Caldilineaceae bacterium]
MINAQCIPISWEFTTGGTLFSWSSGKNLTAKEQNTGHIPVYGGNGVNGFHDKVLVEHSTIIIGRVGANCGNVFVSNGPSWVTDNAIYAKYVPSKINLDFIKIAFALAKLNENSTGSGQPFVNQGMLNEVQIPLPPTSEQQRIVEAIETHFTRLDTAVAALKRAQGNLKRYRSSVLKAACEGKLVPTEAALAQAEGRSYEPAATLLERILNERRRKWEAENPGKKYIEPAAPYTSELPELPDGWCWGTIGQLAAHEPNSITDGPFGSKLKTSHYTSSGPRVIRLQNIGDGVFHDEYAHISLEHFRALEKHQVFSGDVVIAALGSDLPRACIIPDHVGLAIVKADCMRFHSNSQLVTPAYARAALNSRTVKSVASQIIHGIGRPRLNQQEIKELPIPLPPPTEQHRIVAEVERRLSLIDQLEKSIDADLARAERLRQSILKRAFEGKLVPQDPNDEPASVLLERIRAEKKP